jgi:hypothetical protein
MDKTHQKTDTQNERWKKIKPQHDRKLPTSKINNKRGRKNKEYAKQAESNEQNDRRKFININNKRV